MKVRAESFIRFVYPFLFDGEMFKDRADRIAQATCNGGRKLWDSQKFPHDELLPHVADFLNPPDGKDPTALFWKIHDMARHSPNGVGAASSIQWHLVHGNKKQVVFQLEDIQLILFKTGVGFVTVRARPAADGREDWLDLLHYFRYIRGHGVSITASRRLGIDDQKKPLIEDYWSPLARQPQHTNDPKAKVFACMIEGLLHSGRLAKDNGDWWREVFIAGQVLPYAALFVDDVPEKIEDVPEKSDDILPEDEPTLLYRVLNFFRADQEIFPAPQELRLDQPHLLPYAARQWWVFSLDGGAFVACDAPDTPFFRKTLPDHLDTQYFVLYILALHQRFALMGLSEDVSKNWLSVGSGKIGQDDEERETCFRRIRDGLLAFTARGYFAQVMQRRHHHRCYARWQETFQIEQLYREVNHEVREMHEYLLMRRTERIEKLTQHLNWLAAMFLFPALVLSYFDAVSSDKSDRFWLTPLYCSLFAFVAGAGYMYLLNKGFWGKVLSPIKRRIGSEGLSQTQ